MRIWQMIFYDFVNLNQIVRTLTLKNRKQKTDIKYFNLEKCLCFFRIYEDLDNLMECRSGSKN